MSKLLEQAIAKLESRPISEQDSRSILNKNLSCRSIELTRGCTRSIHAKIEHVHF
jgi:hypothetical protein